MTKTVRTAISPTRSENYPEWYQQVIRAADLAELSPVRGCMVIKPWGYSIWENMRRILDVMFKETGHRNAYFPLLIPLSFMQKEADHIEGFAKECAVVTHRRLERNEKGELVPAGPLEEPLVIRPTSETIIGEMFARWIQSYHDLPLLINQWANIVRWEKRTRLFLRTTEFLWQEGHTAHATEEEAIEERNKILDIYAKFAENYLAIPVIKGEKTNSERFPGAVSSYAIEAMMQDRKALQSGTSHFLGQNFARAANINFLDAEGKKRFVWTTSWGVTTRLIGGLIMTHGDDNGLRIPPKVAPAHVVILPIMHKDEKKAEVLDYCDRLAKEIADLSFDGHPVIVEIDSRNVRGGDKHWSWIKNGIPIRLEIGPRDVASDSVFLGRRDKDHKDRVNQTRGEFTNTLEAQLNEMQNNYFEQARKYRDDHTIAIDDKNEFYDFFTPSNRDRPEIHGGFAMAHWSGDTAEEEIIKKDLNVTIRVIPLDGPEEKGKSIISGKPSTKRVVFAKAY